MSVVTIQITSNLPFFFQQIVPAMNNTEYSQILHNYASVAETSGDQWITSIKEEPVIPIYSNVCVDAFTHFIITWSNHMLHDIWVRKMSDFAHGIKIFGYDTLSKIDGI